MSQIKLKKNVIECIKMSTAFKLPMLYIGNYQSRHEIDSFLRKELSKILPKITEDEKKEVNRIYNLIYENYADDTPPVRYPNCNISVESFYGGGSQLRPGEISLAHKGFLVMSNASEFKTSILQMIRTPMESKKIQLCRNPNTVIYDTDFTLIYGTSPCPCGNYGHKLNECLCSRKTYNQYWNKFSNVLLNHSTIILCNLNNESETVETTTEILRNEIVSLREKMYESYNTEIRSMDYESFNTFLTKEQIEDITIKNIVANEDNIENIFKIILSLALIRNTEINEDIINDSISYSMQKFIRH